MNRLIISIIAGLGLLTGSALLHAQQQPEAPPSPGTEQTEISYAEVRKFAEIYVDVEETRSKLSQQMADAPNAQQAQDIQTRMQDEVVSTIEDHGWSWAHYNQVANVISNDAELRRRAINLIEEISEG